MLIEAGEYINSENQSQRIDFLRFELSGAKNAKGAIYFFCGAICGIGEVEAHLRGIHLALKGKKVEEGLIRGYFGGYRKKAEIEYWLIPKGAGFPEPKSSLTIEDVEHYEGKWKNVVMPYDCCDTYEWPTTPRKVVGFPLEIRKALLEKSSAYGSEINISQYRNKSKSKWDKPNADDPYSPLHSWTIKDKTINEKVIENLLESSSPNYVESKCKYPTHSVHVKNERFRNLYIHLDFECSVFEITGVDGWIRGTLKQNSPLEVFISETVSRMKSDL